MQANPASDPGRKALMPPPSARKQESAKGSGEHSVEVMRHTATVARDVRATVGDPRVEDPAIRAAGVNVFYGDAHAIKAVDLDIGKNEITDDYQAFEASHIEDVILRGDKTGMGGDTPGTIMWRDMHSYPAFWRRV